MQLGHPPRTRAPDELSITETPQQGHAAAGRGWKCQLRPSHIAELVLGGGGRLCA